MHDDKGSNVQQYRKSAPFLQSVECIFNELHMGMGDSAYISASFTIPMSAELIHKINIDAFKNNPLHIELAMRFNTDFDCIRSVVVEQGNRGVKRFSTAGHKSAITLYVRWSRTVSHIKSNASLLYFYTCL